MDDRRLGRVLRALRRKARLRQADVAAKVGCHQTTISDVERGRLDNHTFGLLKRIFEAVDSRLEGDLPWRGADAERLLNTYHSDLVESAGMTIGPWGWDTLPEVTYANYRDRGSIDLFGGATKSVAVFEMKSQFGAIDDTVRRHDEKVRLARKICHERFGWWPQSVARILVVADESTNRRLVAAHQSTFRSTYPAHSRQVRAWLRRPNGSLAGIWFLSPKARALGNKKYPGRDRVRTHKSSVA